jgi:hypothetical protein
VSFTRFEVVDVGDHERHRSLLAVGARDLVIELPREVGAVVDAGQLVDHHEHAQLLERVEEIRRVLGDDPEDAEALLGEKARSLAPRFEHVEEGRAGLAHARHRHRPESTRDGTRLVRSDGDVDRGVDRLGVEHGLDAPRLGQVGDVDREHALSDPLRGERLVPRLPVAQGLRVPRLVGCRAEREEADLVALEHVARRGEDRAQDVADVGLEILCVPLVPREELPLHRDQVRQALVEEPAPRVPVRTHRAHERLLAELERRGKEEGLVRRGDAIAHVRTALALEAVHALEGPALEQPLGDLPGEPVAGLTVEIHQTELDEVAPFLGRSLAEAEGSE